MNRFEDDSAPNNNFIENDPRDLRDEAKHKDFKLSFAFITSYKHNKLNTYYLIRKSLFLKEYFIHILFKRVVYII